MIDLHTHTSYSDGTWTVSELLENAEKAGIEILSITDHESAKAHVELEKNPNLREKFNGKILIGTELNCTFKGVKIEVLAYKFNLESVQKWLDNYYTKEKNKQRLQNEFVELVEICKRKNIKIENNLEFNPETQYPVDTVYYSITKFDENKIFFTDEQWNSNELFYRTCTAHKNFILYRDFSKELPKIEEIAELIHKNGGKIFLAHLFKYELDNHLKFLEELYKANIIDGVEVYHSSFSKENEEQLIEFCRKHDLLMSGGSDCHGERRKERKIGIGYGNMNIDKKIVENWI